MGKLRVYCLKTLNKLSIYPLGNTPSAPSDWRTNRCWLIWIAWWTNCASAPGRKLLPRWLALKFLMNKISDAVLSRLIGPSPSLNTPMSLQTIRRTLKHTPSRAFLNKPRRSALQMFQSLFRVHSLMPRFLAALVVRSLTNQ